MKPGSHPYLTTLTPLRGIAALFVVIFHCNLVYQVFLPPGYTTFLDNCWLWVDFFFVLSGFIMCYAYSKYFSERVNKNNFKKYMGARFARVYPLHFITTIWAFIITAVIVHLSAPMDPFFAEIFNLRALPACLLLVQSMHVGYFTAPLNTPSWSLSTEWWAYIIFPFILPFFMKLKRWGMLVTTVMLVVFIIALRWVIGRITFGSNGPTFNCLTDFGFLRCLAGFFVGMLTYTFFNHRSGYTIVKRDWFFLISFLGVLAAMHFGVMDIVIFGFFPLIILSAACNQTVIKRILDTRVLQRLGDWSFTIYMVHMPIIFTFLIFKIKKQPGLLSDFGKYLEQKPEYVYGLIMCGVIVTITLIMASLVYRFVEVPARNYFNRAFDKKKPEISAERVEV